MIGASKQATNLICQYILTEQGGGLPKHSKTKVFTMLNILKELIFKTFMDLMLDFFLEHSPKKKTIPKRNESEIT